VIKVMAVDDDKEFLTEITEVLTSNHYKTIPLLGSRYAVTMACRHRPDVLLLDLKMEGLGGFEIAKELRRLPQTMYIPIICITGFYTDSKYQLLIKTYSVKEIFTKPVHPPDILTAIDRAVKDKNHQ